jgi:cytochrome c peroxidase
MRPGRVLEAQPHLEPLTDDDYYPIDESIVELGRLLFHDKLLSGNKNISCSTCHHRLTATGDGLSLPVGEGGRGLGISRDTGAGIDRIHERVPRNAPPVWNIGAKEYIRMFHDGRLTIDETGTYASGFVSPAGHDLPEGLDNIVAAQAMFPVTSMAEMAGQPGENPDNEIAEVAHDVTLIWERLASRLSCSPYARMFVRVFDEIEEPDDIRFVHAANAIAAYENTIGRTDQSPFDLYLRGDHEAMRKAAIRGMRLFYGKARCNGCHAGVLQTDHLFHAIGMPQIGTGRGDDAPGYDDGLDDFGREQVTLDEIDRYRFRTPSLRNVVLNGPWGHAGAYDDLETVVRHHLEPVRHLRAYYELYRDQARLPLDDELALLDFRIVADPDRIAFIEDKIELPVIRLDDDEVDEILAFLHALTDPRSLNLRAGMPGSVPSTLPIFD